MYLVQANNVNDAFVNGVYLLRQEGVTEPSRAGEVLVMPRPVTTMYLRPQERVLFDEIRDANPFFHLMEALWMLAGSHDALWLDQFVSDFSRRFAEDDGVQHGAYGFRWRSHFDIDGAGHPLGLPDQLNVLAKLLRENPHDRRIVLTMWDPVADLGAQKRDVPCNTHAYLRVRGAKADHWPDGETITPSEQVLDLTVCCRSNDIIWGAYGANAVHFSILQEYLAARVGVGIGTYYQISNNFHAYKDVLDKQPQGWTMEEDPYLTYRPMPLVEDPNLFDSDLRAFFLGDYDLCQNPFFEYVAVPMFKAAKAWKKGDSDATFEYLKKIPAGNDWGVVAKRWCQRRMEKKRQRFMRERAGGA